MLRTQAVEYDVDGTTMIGYLAARRAFEDEMRAAGVADWRLEVYGGVGHSFTNPSIDERGFPGFAYDERADRRSWQWMLDLFHERLDPT